MLAVATGAAKILRVFVEGSELYYETEKVVRPGQNGNGDPTLVDCAAIAVRVFILSCSASEALGKHAEASAKVLKHIKLAETSGRLMDLPIRVCKILNDDYRHLSGSEILQQHVLGPIVGFARAAVEADAYTEREYMELSPTEFGAGHRPVYKYNEDTDVMEQVGTKPLDMAECRSNLEGLEKGAAALEIVEAVGKGRLITRGANAAARTRDQVENLYRRLADRLRPGPGPAIPVNLDPFDLTAFPRIPDELEHDAVFSQYVCSITHHPIRRVVCDPNGRTLYERSAIIQHLANDPRSPMTRNPMTVANLIQKPAIQALIDSRLAYHSNRLRQLAQAPAGLNQAPDAGLLAAANAEL